MREIELRVLSLGAGVQSTTLALMAAHGEIDPPDCAIFADTQWEPRAVYEHLAWLRSGNVLPFPVHIVTAGNLRQSIRDRRNTTGGRFAAIPWHITNENGSAGMGRRQCIPSWTAIKTSGDTDRQRLRGPTASMDQARAAMRSRYRCWPRARVTGTSFRRGERMPETSRAAD